MTILDSENLLRAKRFYPGQCAQTAQSDQGPYFSHFPEGPFCLTGHIYCKKVTVFCCSVQLIASNLKYLHNQLAHGLSPGKVHEYHVMVHGIAIHEQSHEH